MRDTKPQRVTVSSLNYRDATGTPTATAPDIDALAAAALAFLARAGTAANRGPNAGDRTWRASATGRDGFPLTVTCGGPDLPEGVPRQTAHPSIIPVERPWVGVYRLEVRAPLIVLDLYWRPDAPLRIMSFSRGDWERELLALGR